MPHIKMTTAAVTLKLRRLVAAPGMTAMAAKGGVQLGSQEHALAGFHRHSFHRHTPV
jgi:hypothetical protein